MPQLFEFDPLGDQDLLGSEKYFATNAVKIWIHSVSSDKNEVINSKPAWWRNVPDEKDSHKSLDSWKDLCPPSNSFTIYCVTIMVNRPECGKDVYDVLRRSFSGKLNSVYNPKVAA